MRALPPQHLQREAPYGSQAVAMLDPREALAVYSRLKHVPASVADVEPEYIAALEKLRGAAQEAAAQRRRQRA